MSARAPRCRLPRTRGDAPGEGGANIIPVTVLVSIFGARGKGMGPLNRATDIVRDLVNRVRVGSIQLMAAGGRQYVDDTEDEAWAEMRVTTRGEFEDWL